MHISIYYFFSFYCQFHFYSFGPQPNGIKANHSNCYVSLVLPEEGEQTPKACKQCSSSCTKVDPCSQFSKLYLSTMIFRWSWSRAVALLWTLRNSALPTQTPQSYSVQEPRPGSILHRYHLPGTTWQGRASTTESSSQVRIDNNIIHCAWSW